MNAGPGHLLSLSQAHVTPRALGSERSARGRGSHGDSSQPLYNVVSRRPLLRLAVPLRSQNVPVLRSPIAVCSAGSGPGRSRSRRRPSAPPPAGRAGFLWRLRPCPAPPRRPAPLVALAPCPRHPPIPARRFPQHRLRAVQGGPAEAAPSGPAAGCAAGAGGAAAGRRPCVRCCAPLGPGTPPPPPPPEARSKVSDAVGAGALPLSVAG